jgi:AcrR family transcriptional regulator
MTPHTATAETSSPPLRADARRNRERLLEAARDAFVEHGPEASLDEIAKRAGLGIATLYRHFPTREVLQEAVLRDGIDRLRADAARRLDAAVPFDALAAWLDELLVFSTTYRGLTASMMMTLLKQEPEFSAACVAMKSAVAALVERAQDAGQLRADADSSDIVKLVNAIGMATEPGPEGLERGRRMLAVTVDGLRATAPTPA